MKNFLSFQLFISLSSIVIALNSVGCIEKSVWRDSVSLMPDENEENRFKQDNNEYGLQGNWYSYHLDKSSFFDTPLIDLLIQTNQTSPSSTPPIDKSNETNQHIQSIDLSGSATRSLSKNMDPVSWGLGFGFELCYVGADNSDTDAEKSALRLDSQQVPFAPEHTYPLKHCPFNRRIHGQFKGIEFKIKNSNFDIIEVHFKEVEIEPYARRRCYIYNGCENTITDSEGVITNTNRPLCPCETDGDTLKVTVRSTDVRYGEETADIKDVAAIHFHIYTSPFADTDPLGFTLHLSDVNAIIEEDGSNIPEIGSNKEFKEDYYSFPKCNTACPVPEKEWIGISDNSDSENDDKMNSFHIMQKEVTVGQYYDCFVNGPCGRDNKDFYFVKWPICLPNLYKEAVEKGDTKTQNDLKDRSANCINYPMAAIFCEWQGGRLPTAEEWEYAASSGKKEKEYPWSRDDSVADAIDLTSCDSKVAFMHDDTRGDACGDSDPKPVKGCDYSTNGQTEDGLCDMAGNVSEWTETPYELGKSPNYMIIKGGSFYSTKDTLKISAKSMEYKTPYNWGRMGFRCIRYR